MTVCIVSYEEVNAWILGKFARKLNEELNKLGVNCKIERSPNPSADINHHIIYLEYNEKKSTGINTTMITHVDDIFKLKMIQRQMKVADAGICMSRETMQTLCNTGIASSKICYINPAHDQATKLRKTLIGITSKVHPDGCKREYILSELVNHIDPAFFKFSIMGSGWGPIVENIKRLGFDCDYIPEFHYDKYIKLIPQLDYYLYTGKDEGSMGWIDAVASGVKTIVTAQGYHLDAENGTTHFFDSTEDLISIFNTIETERKKILDSVSTWTWRDYAIKHLEVWQYLYNKSEIKSKYADGLNSLIEQKHIDSSNIKEYKKNLVKGTINRNISRIRNIRDFKTFKEKLKNLINRKLGRS